MENILRSTLAAGAILAMTAAAFMPGSALATTRSDTTETTFIVKTISGQLTLVAQPSDDDSSKMVIQCGPGSSSPFTPCDIVKTVCANLGGSYEPGACTTPDWPPPPRPD
jgi:hypothetical protein